jgi:hypothetical protein
MKLSQQEQSFLTYLIPRAEVYWEELVQFCKNPATVKLKTVQKVISDLKKKYKDNNQALPFHCTFKSMQTQTQNPKMVSTGETSEYLGQKLVQIKRPTKQAEAMLPPGFVWTTDSKPIAEMRVIEIEKPSTINAFDFILKSFTQQIVTKSGVYALNHEEFELFNYLFNNKSKFISLEELRDKVCYPKYGSKLPARWFSAIQRRVSHIRQHIPETRNRLLTAKQNNNTGYIFN